MKKKKTSSEQGAPAEGTGRAKRAAANAAVFLRKNIYIILMILCVLAIAAMIVVAAVLGTQEETLPDTPTIEQPGDTPTIDPDDDDPVIDPDDNAPEPVWTFAPVMPVEGEVIKGHSETELVFSATENKWKAHIGTDFSAEAGSEVKALFDGKVTGVNEDPYYGGVVEITHENGYVTTCKLVDEVSVSVGDAVKAGDKIGVVGSDFYFECADGPHVHVELKINDKYGDIVAYLKEGDK